MDDYISLEQQQAWADQLLDALEDTTTSTGTTVAWLQANLGLLNTSLRREYALSGDSITPAMSAIDSGVYNEFYMCYWLKKRSRTMVGSMDIDWTEMRGDDQGSVKRVSNTQKAQTYQSLAKDCDINLKELIKEVKGGVYATPVQITFNERRSVPRDITCGCYSWSPRNPVWVPIDSDPTGEIPVLT